MRKLDEIVADNIDEFVTLRMYVDAKRVLKQIIKSTIAEVMEELWMEDRHGIYRDFEIDAEGFSKDKVKDEIKCSRRVRDAKEKTSLESTNYYDEEPDGHPSYGLRD